MPMRMYSKAECIRKGLWRLKIEKFHAIYIQILSIKKDLNISIIIMYKVQ